MIVLNNMMGRVAPSFMSLSQWCVTYRAIIETRGLKHKTLQNRLNNINHLTDTLGDMRMRSIRPMHIAAVVKSVWDEGNQFTARRVLTEARDIFNEAVLAGVLMNNPAAPIKPLHASVKRKRLTLDEWDAMFSVSLNYRESWVSRLLLLALITGQRRADLAKMAFSDVRDGSLFVIQQKTGARIELPLELRLDVIDWSLGEAVEYCQRYGRHSDYMIRKSNGGKFSEATLTVRFQHTYSKLFGYKADGSNPTLHECRSLSEREYRKQGVDTQTLLGHRHQYMTDQYNNDRGLTKDDYKKLVL